MDFISCNQKSQPGHLFQASVLKYNPALKGWQRRGAASTLVAGYGGNAGSNKGHSMFPSINILKIKITDHKVFWRRRGQRKPSLRHYSLLLAYITMSGLITCLPYWNCLKTSYLWSLEKSTSSYSTWQLETPSCPLEDPPVSRTAVAATWSALNQYLWLKERKYEGMSKWMTELTTMPHTEQWIRAADMGDTFEHLL